MKNNVEISVTFGTHQGHPFTYLVYLTNGIRCVGRIYSDYELFKKQMQDFIKAGLRALT